MLNEFSRTNLNEVYLLLTEEQRTVLDNNVKRGKKTKWLNIWAKKIGVVLTEEDLEDPEKSMETLLEWILVDYEDALTVDPNLRCECGRALRYRYTVLHKKSGQIYKLGIVHFEQHTGLSPDMVRAITKGLEEIDLERDEILSKVIRKWELPFRIPTTIEIPNDMIEQLRVDLPLLERQVKRIEDLIRNDREQRFNKLFKTSQANPIHKDNKTENFTSELQPIDVSKINPVMLYNKLKSFRINSYEARELFYFMKHYQSEIKDYGLSKDDIKASVLKALGSIGNPDIRKWLVEIEYL